MTTKINKPQNTSTVSNGNGKNSTQGLQYIDSAYCLYFAFFAVVFVLYPILARCCWFGKNSNVPLRGLNLPRGSVRSMLAIAIIGSYLITLFISLLSKLTNNGAATSQQLDLVLTPLGSLASAIIGFYFASRGSQTPDKEENNSGNKDGASETQSSNGQSIKEQEKDTTGVAYTTSNNS